MAEDKTIYQCDQEMKKMLAEQTWIDGKGDRHCPTCGGKVRDVTHTRTGSLVLLWVTTGVTAR